EEIKKAYQQVRRQEKNNPWKQRHMDYEEYFDKNFDKEENKFVKGIKKGSFHVATEFLYQLHKFSYIGRDTVPKYVIRNRKMIGTVIAIVVGVNLLGNTKETTIEETKIPVEQEVTTTQVNEEKVSYELIRKYEIESGDTLYDLAQETGVSVEKMQEYNHLDTSRIVAGETLKIPYTVAKEDLGYYTSTDSIGIDSVYDFAEKHHTTVGTILELNQDRVY
ncbi:MAG: LysM peptidoglycan-binding domain-containing protein, partial [Bacilli bacterium]|nr:LysM peptidoglycan-binding domain-containing protein [Bacilli bacterium]